MEQDTFKWIRFHTGKAKGHIAKVRMEDGFVVVESMPQPLNQSWAAIFYTGQTMQEYEEKIITGGIPPTSPAFHWVDSPEQGDGFVLVGEINFWHPLGAPGFNNIDFNGDNVPDGMPAVVTVKEILDDGAFKDFNKFTIQEELNPAEAIIRAAAFDNPPSIISVPCLFFGKGHPDPLDPGAVDSVAFTPGPTNLQPTNGKVYAPRQYGPVKNGIDLFEQAIKNTIQEPFRFTDCWIYHRSRGEVHCGSNVRRALPTWNWWEKLNPPANTP